MNLLAHHKGFHSVDAHVPQVFSCNNNKLMPRICDKMNVKTLLTLADHDSEAVRVTILRLLDYLLRTRGPFFSKFVEENGFRALTNQLLQHPVTSESFTSTCNIFTGQAMSSVEEVTGGEKASIDVMYTVLPLDKAALKSKAVYHGHPDCAQVLFSMLMNSVISPVLCINIFHTLHTIFVVRVDVRSKMIKHGIIQTICDVLAVAQDMEWGTLRDHIDSGSAEFTHDNWDSQSSSRMSIYGQPPVTSTPIHSKAGKTSGGGSGTGAAEGGVSEGPSDDEGDVDLYGQLVLHAEAFLVDITMQLCAVVQQEKLEGNAMLVIEDTMDYLWHWGIHPEIGALATPHMCCSAMS